MSNQHDPNYDCDAQQRLDDIGADTQSEPPPRTAHSPVTVAEAYGDHWRGRLPYTPLRFNGAQVLGIVRYGASYKLLLKGAAEWCVVSAHSKLWVEG